jgi:hypothetical protein
MSLLLFLQDVGHIFGALADSFLLMIQIMLFYVAGAAAYFGLKTSHHHSCKILQNYCIVKTV